MGQDKESEMIPFMKAMPISALRLIGLKFLGLMLGLLFWLIVWDLAISTLVMILFPTYGVYPTKLIAMLGHADFRLGALGTGYFGTLLQLSAAALTGMAVVLATRTLISAAFLGSAAYAALIWFITHITQADRGTDPQVAVKMAVANGAVAAIMLAVMFPLWFRQGYSQSNDDAPAPSALNSPADRTGFLRAIANFWSRRWMIFLEVVLAAWLGFFADVTQLWTMYLAAAFVLLLMADAAGWLSPQEWSLDFSLHTLPIDRTRLFAARIAKRITIPLVIAIAAAAPDLSVVFTNFRYNSGSSFLMGELMLVGIVSRFTLIYIFAGLMVRRRDIRLVITAAVLVLLMSIGKYAIPYRSWSNYFDGYGYFLVFFLAASVSGIFAVTALRLFFRSPFVVLLMAIFPTIVWAVAISILTTNVFLVRLGAPPLVQYLWTIFWIGSLCLGTAYIGFCRSRLLEQSDNRRGLLGILLTIALTVWVGFFITADPYQLCYLIFRH
jgi:hypothetical protein